MRIDHIVETGLIKLLVFHFREEIRLVKTSYKGDGKGIFKRDREYWVWPSLEYKVYVENTRLFWV